MHVFLKSTKSSSKYLQFSLSNVSIAHRPSFFKGNDVYLSIIVFCQEDACRGRLF